MPETPICEYFLLCDHESVGVTWVNVLGLYVPVCQRCADKLDLEVAPWRRISNTELEAGFSH